MRAGGGKRGFSLIEILIAMFVLVVGVLAVIGTYPSLLKMSEQSWGYITAMTLAQEKMEQILDGLYGNPIAETNCGSQYVDYPDPELNVTRTWCASPDPGDQSGTTFTNLQHIYVQVTWNERGVLRTVIIDSYHSP